MLPSMPLLMTPMKVKVTNEDSTSDTSNDSPLHQNQPATIKSENSNERQSADDQNLAIYENDDLLRLEINPTDHCDIVIEASSDHVRHKRSLPEPCMVQKKKKKNQHKKIVAAVTPDTSDDSAHYFAEAYFQEVRSRLDEQHWNKFLQLLVDFQEQEGAVLQLYGKVEALLRHQRCPDLAHLFLAFLLPEQALAAGQLMPFLEIHRTMDFNRKLNILLMKRQARQVLDAVKGVVEGGGEGGVESVLPLLKASQLLTDSFTQLLPTHRPPDSLMTDFETIDLSDDWEFETMSVPPDSAADPYGHDSCICACHNHHHQQHLQHCVRCGIKYVNGRIFLQQGKVLRPAKVTFSGPKHSDWQKWHPLHQRRTLHNPDSEDDGVKKSPKTPRTPRIRVSKSKVNKKDAGDVNVKDEVLDGISPLVREQSEHNDIAEDCEERHAENYEHDFDEIVVEECNTEEEEEEEEIEEDEEEEEDMMINKEVHSDNESSMEAEDLSKELESGNDYSFEDEEFEDFEDTDMAREDSPKHTSDQLQRMFESHTNVEQDTTDTDKVHVKTEPDIEIKVECPEFEVVKVESSVKVEEEMEWSREEDQIILQTFQHENGLEQTFQTASLQLPNRSKEEIQQRFEVLLKLLKEMISDESSPS